MLVNGGEERRKKRRERRAGVERSCAVTASYSDVC